MRERSLRKGCDGQSQACKDCGEGLPRLSIEESFLSKCIACLSPVCCPWKVHGVYIRCSAQLFMRFVTVHMRSRSKKKKKKKKKIPAFIPLLKKKKKKKKS